MYTSDSHACEPCLFFLAFSFLRKISAVPTLSHSGPSLCVKYYVEEVGAVFEGCHRNQVVAAIGRIKAQLLFSQTCRIYHPKDSIRSNAVKIPARSRRSLQGRDQCIAKNSFVQIWHTFSVKVMFLQSYHL